MSKPLKVGLIGTGAVSGAHLPAYTQFPEKVKLTAVCDIIEEAARERAKGANVDAIYLDYKKMLKEADIDAVDICTSHDMHAPIVTAAAEAGKHVLVEKPMGNNMQECRDMIAATDKAGVTFMVAQMHRYSPTTQAVRRVLQDGELGTIRAARCDITMNAPEILREGQIWMLDGKAGGGVGMTNTIHVVDLLRYLVGDVKRVTGVCKTVSPRLINGAEDIFCGTLEFENGAVGTMFCLWSVPRSPISTGYMLFGDDGALYLPQLPMITSGQVMVSSPKRDEPGTQPVNQLVGGNRGMSSFVQIEPVTEGLASDNSFINEIIHFAECCQEGKEPISSGRDNLGSMKIILGVYESARTGKAVDLVSL